MRVFSNIMSIIWLIVGISTLYFKPENENIFWYCIISSQLWATTGE